MKINPNNITALACEDGTVRLYNLEDPTNSIP